jgi:hypothetical protein
MLAGLRLLVDRACEAGIDESARLGGFVLNRWRFDHALDFFKQLFFRNSANYRAGAQVDGRLRDPANAKAI